MKGLLAAKTKIFQLNSKNLLGEAVAEVDAYGRGLEMKRKKKAVARKKGL